MNVHDKCNAQLHQASSMASNSHIRGVFKKFCNSSIKKNGNVTNCIYIITTEFNAFATFFWQTVISTKIEFFCLSLQPRREESGCCTTTLQSNPQVHDCTAGCSRLRLRTVRPPCIQSWPGSQWLFSVVQFEVSPSWCPLSWRWSAQGSCQGVAGGQWRDRQKNSILVELTVCQNNVANALNSVVIILKNKLQFVTFPFFFMVELQNFLNAPRILNNKITCIHCLFVHMFIF